MLASLATDGSLRSRVNVLASLRLQMRSLRSRVNVLASLRTACSLSLAQLARYRFANPANPAFSADSADSAPINLVFPLLPRYAEAPLGTDLPIPPFALREALPM